MCFEARGSHIRIRFYLFCFWRQPAFARVFMVVLSLLKVLTNFVRQKQLFLLNKLTVLSDKGILLVEQITVLSDKAFLLVEQKQACSTNLFGKVEQKQNRPCFLLDKKSVCRTKNSLFFVEQNDGEQSFPMEFNRRVAKYTGRHKTRGLLLSIAFRPGAVPPLEHRSDPAMPYVSRLLPTPAVVLGHCPIVNYETRTSRHLPVDCADTRLVPLPIR